MSLQRPRFCGLAAAILVSCLPLGCKTFNTSPSQEAQASCRTQPNYAWINNQCLAKNSAAYQAVLCAQKGQAFVWINEQCVARSNFVDPITACRSRNDGSIWQPSGKAPNSGQCVSPVELLNAQNDCLKTKGNKWDDVQNQCLTAVAQACLADSTKVWINGECLSVAMKEARNDCLARTDGSLWRGGRCVSGAEQRCGEKGYDFAWRQRSSAVQDGVCEAKGFLDYCLDPSPPTDVAWTIRSIFEALSADPKDCRMASQTLTGIASLNLSNRRIQNLKPLTNLKNLRALDLQSNAVFDLTPVASLTLLTTLNLSRNAVVSLDPIVALGNLTSLFLGFNQIEDLSPIASLSKLQILYLNNNQIKDVGPLTATKAALAGGLNALEQLFLDENCSLTDAKSLGQLPRLRLVSLRLTGLPSTSFLPTFTGSVQVNYTPCR